MKKESFATCAFCSILALLWDCLSALSMCRTDSSPSFFIRANELSISYHNFLPEFIYIVCYAINSYFLPLQKMRRDIILKKWKNQRPLTRLLILMCFENWRYFQQMGYYSVFCGHLTEHLLKLKENPMKKQYDMSVKAWIILSVDLWRI